jgi:1,4-alpha-glucan branching enzyme
MALGDNCAGTAFASVYAASFISRNEANISMPSAIAIAPAPKPVIHAGMGAIFHDRGVAFRVWAPNAAEVYVTGTFNDWHPTATPMKHEARGYWYADVPEAGVGDEYLYRLVTPAGELRRIDPYAREVTNSVGHTVLHDPEFDWRGDHFKMPPHNELVIYEMHIGTFNDQHPEEDAPATFSDAVKRFDHLRRLGVNAIQVMPIAEFAGNRSWGYNPSHMFAVESSYGGPRAFKTFVKEAHRSGFAVILDVVYNHFGPTDLQLWRFDGWGEGGGGIYFYNDWRAETPWGHTRPDYGRGEVRQFIRDNAMMWLEEYHVDGLRYDMTLYIRSVRSDGEPNLPDGWSLMQWINGEVRARYPGKILIAEDLQNSDALTADIARGGGGFCAQWDANFVHPVREAVIVQNDEWRSMNAVADSIRFSYNGDPMQRVIYSESHDEVANGKARVPQEINPHDPKGYYAQKRSTLAAALVATAPGIPMLFQGQEFLEGEWFRDTVPLDWHLRDEYRGIVRLYRDLIALRRNLKGMTRGLSGRGVNVYHVNDHDNMIAFHRFDKGGVGDDVVVVLNFHRDRREGYRIGFPALGVWKLLLDSDWTGYSEVFTGVQGEHVIAKAEGYDGFPASAAITIGPYTCLIYGRA